MSIRKKILILTITLTIGCGIAVLASSIFLFNREISNAMLEKNDVAENVVRHEIGRLKAQAYIRAQGIAKTEDFIEAIEGNNHGQVTLLANVLQETAHFDFCFVIDHAGIVLFRTHEPESYGDDIAHHPQVEAALAGKTEVHLMQGETIRLGIAVGTPIFAENGNIIGALSMGFRLDNQDFAVHLKELTGCEITFFREDVRVASTLLQEDGTPAIGTRAPLYISERVFAGETHVSRIDLAGRNLLAKYFPLYGANDEIVGMAFIGNYTEEETNRILFFIVRGFLIALAVLVVCVIIASFVSGTIERQLDEMMKGIEKRDYLLQAANERLTLMLDASPLCSEIWDRSFKVIDCNKAGVRLYGFKDKWEYMDKFLTYCSPEYQPDGQRSDVMAGRLLNQAFEEGCCSFDWMHRMPGDGSPIPSEVTLVRVKYGDDDVVIGYTRDMREVTTMESKIHRLEIENEKIYYDALTGIHNRRFFDETISRVLRSLARTGGTLSVMMIDIDYFKKYNDTYGHSTGDDCLRKVSSIISGCMSRSDDFVARYGGEEFVVVMPNTGESGAMIVAENILNKVLKCNIPHKNSDAANFVTVSIGITSGSVHRNHTADVFINKADTMLYISKQNGRNRCSFEQL